MVTYLLFNKGTLGARWAEQTVQQLEHEQVTAELIDADSPRGIQLAENYDVLGRPAIVMVKDDGTPVQIWQGQDNMPLISDIGCYARV